MFLPMKGNVSESGGMVSETTSKNTARDSSTVISRDTFSPESGGNRNPRNAIVEIMVQGKIRFMR